MEPLRQTITLRHEGGSAHEIVFYDWGDALASQTVVCVHGLTRNARDFDLLAAELARRGKRVLCLSMAGRGESQWLSDPMEYNYGTYMQDCMKILDNFHLRQVDWVGTSMGGIIGMLIASAHPGRIRKLVLNDIGVRLRKEALERIYAYVRSIPASFSSRTEADAYLRAAFSPFGICELPVWHDFVSHSLLSAPDDAFRLACDPAIIEPVRQETHDFSEINDVNLSAFWENITIPTLILRGELSDILDNETVHAMRTTNPHADTYLIKGVGHAPALMTPDQIQLVSQWLGTSGLKIQGI